MLIYLSWPYYYCHKFCSSMIFLSKISWNQTWNIIKIHHSTSPGCSKWAKHYLGHKRNMMRLKLIENKNLGKLHNWKIDYFGHICSFKLPTLVGLSSYKWSSLCHMTYNQCNIQQMKLSIVIAPLQCMFSNAMFIKVFL